MPDEILDRRPDPREVLRRRARALAQPPPVDNAAGDDRLSVLQFRLGAEIYAVECRFVREVLRLRQVTPLPGTPAFLVGIVNVRGQILSVVDLRHVLDLPPEPVTHTTRTVILQAPPMEFGIVVDDVLATAAVSPGELEPAPPALAGRGSRYVRGVAPDGVIHLEAAAILSDPALLLDDPTAREPRGRTGDTR